MLDHILSEDSTFQNLSILIDIDDIIAQTDLAENSSKTAFFASNSIELRLLFESYIRDHEDNSSAPPFIIVYNRQDATLPYDIEKKCRHRSVTLSSLFPSLDEDVIRDLSSQSYKVLLEKAGSSRTASSKTLSENETAASTPKAIA